MSFATKLVISKGHSIIQSQAKALLASLFSSKNEFFDKKVWFLLLCWASEGTLRPWPNELNNLLNMRLNILRYAQCRVAKWTEHFRNIFSLFFMQLFWREIRDFSFEKSTKLLRSTCVYRYMLSVCWVEWPNELNILLNKLCSSSIFDFNQTFTEKCSETEQGVSMNWIFHWTSILDDVQFICPGPYWVGILLFL